MVLRPAVEAELHVGAVFAIVPAEAVVTQPDRHCTVLLRMAAFVTVVTLDVFLAEEVPIVEVRGFVEAIVGAGGFGIG